MPVYVGKREYAFARLKLSHMVADTLEELHAMADKVGVSRKYFQAKPERPHYDICKSSKLMAIKLGAQEVDDRVIIEMFNNQLNNIKMYELEGVVTRVFKAEEVGQNRTLKQCFLVKLDTDPKYPKEVHVEAWGKAVNYVPGEGTSIVAQCEVSSRENNGRYYTSVKAISIKQL
jgi:hypothetical protein